MGSGAEPHAPAGSTLLAVEHLTTVFDGARGPVPAVSDVSFQIGPGETLCLVGESGSGKSITARSIVRLLPPSAHIAAGRVVFDGRNLLELDSRAMEQVRGARIGYVFQDPMTALNPVLTIGSQLEETLLVHGLARRREAHEKAIEWLRAVSLPDPERQAREYAHQLSGGLRQRALIAMALAGNPQLLIADEPTTALDVTIQAQVLELLRDLRRRLGLAMLLITHDFGIVAEMADRVAVMHGGRIVEQNSLRALFREPRHECTRRLLSALRHG